MLWCEWSITNKGKGSLQRYLREIPKFSWVIVEPAEAFGYCPKYSKCPLKFLIPRML